MRFFYASLQFFGVAGAFGSFSRDWKPDYTVRKNPGIDFIPLNESTEADIEIVNVSNVRMTWNINLQKAECFRRRNSDLRSDIGLYCNEGLPVLYSATLQMAYVGNFLAPSFHRIFKAFGDVVQFHSTDASWKDKLLMSKVTFFTFVRDPRDKQLQAYAEVELTRSTGLSNPFSLELQQQVNVTDSGSLTYVHVGRRKNGGVDRFAAYLDDLTNSRFPKPGQSWYDAEAAQSQLAILCGHPLHFIGHLETIEEDWATIQEYAKISVENRTVASIRMDQDEFEDEDWEVWGDDIDEHMTVIVLSGKESKKNRISTSDFAHYHQDMSVDRTAEFNHHFCEVYYAEFVCLGYKVPDSCQGAISKAAAAGTDHPYLRPIVVNEIVEEYMPLSGANSSDNTSELEQFA